MLKFKPFVTISPALQARVRSDARARTGADKNAGVEPRLTEADFTAPVKGDVKDRGFVPRSRR